MLSAKLGYLDTSIYQLHCFITHAVYFVAEDERIFFIFIGFEIIQHDAFFGLLNGNDRITFFP